MATFEVLSKESDFIKLDAKRDAALDALIVHKESLEALDTEKPSKRAFHRLEVNIDEELKLFKVASNAVTAYFSKNGGDILNDPGYKEYRGKSCQNFE